LFQLTTPTQNEAGSVQVKLLVLADLDFETSQLHMLTLTASDVSLQFIFYFQFYLIEIDYVLRSSIICMN